MCGIVGYIGNRDVQPILVGGLSKLEYRGYDSAGVAVMEREQLEVRKEQGRLANLADKLEKRPLKGTIGIGHTRWATHGGPTDANSHPHTDMSGAFSVVHNGIIENYLDIKEELLAKGIEFTSETDTEVIVHLIAEQYDGDIASTVRNVIRRLQGAYSLGVITSHEPDKLIAVRQASPLVIGTGNGENFIASDISAFIEHTRNVYILDDGEMAVLTGDNVTILDAETGKPVVPELHVIDWDEEQAGKGSYEHYMLKEIHEQPSTLRNTMAGRIDAHNRIAFEGLELSEQQIQQIENIMIIACGTAYHAGLAGKAVIETLTRIPTEVDIASEFRYRDPIVKENTYVIVVSQSGETADTIAAMKECQRRGAKVLAITNAAGSTIARDADDCILTKAGPEIAVASTKAYTAQLLAFSMLGIYLAQAKRTLDDETRRALVDGIKVIPYQVEKVLKHIDEIKWFAESILRKRSVFFIGRGLDYAAALEGSLKLKEISYIHSEAYPAGELKHGSLALIEEGTPVIALVTQQKLFEKTMSNIKEVKARGAYVMGITTDGHAELLNSVDEACFVPRTHPLFAPIVAAIPMQLLSYYTSLALGNDIDKPRNLAKSVTVE